METTRSVGAWDRGYQGLYGLTSKIPHHVANSQAIHVEGWFGVLKHGG